LKWSQFRPSRWASSPLHSQPSEGAAAPFGARSARLLSGQTVADMCSVQRYSSRNNDPMLPDLFAPGLLVVFCGTEVARTQLSRTRPLLLRAREQILATPPRRWLHAHASQAGGGRLAPVPGHRHHGPGEGHGAEPRPWLDYGRAGEVAAHVIAAAPQWVAFNGLTARRAAAVQLGFGRRKRWHLASSHGASVKVASTCCPTAAVPTHRRLTRRSSSGGPASVSWWVSSC